MIKSALAEIANDDVDLVILVDESKSLSPSDVVAEQEALKALLSLPLLRDRGIRVAVLPFSSGSESPRRLTECSLTVIDEAGQRALYERCPPQITRQTSDANRNTDFASAFRAANEIFEEDPNDRRNNAIILLTDGRYDPDDDDVISTEEKSRLDSELERAKTNLVTIWSIGFGKNVDLAALKSYSDAGFRNDTCQYSPKAYLSGVEELGTQMQEVMNGVLCGTVTPPRPTPSEHFVHPLINTVAVSVRTADGMPPILKDHKGKVLCDGEWKRLDSYFSCLVEVDGSSSGNWKVEAIGGEAIWETAGEVQLSLSECDTRPVLGIYRGDSNPIDWSAADVWPQALIERKTSSGELKTPLIVSLDNKQFEIDPDGASEVRVSLANESVIVGDSLEGIKAEPVSCQLGRPVATSSSEPTQPPQSDPTIPTTDPGTKPGGDSGFPVAVVILGMLVLVLIGYLAFRRRTLNRFPNGTELFVQSRDTRNFVPFGDNVVGRRSFGVSVISGDLVFVEDPKDAEISLTYSRLGEVLINEQKPSDGDEQKSEAKRSEPINHPFSLGGFMMRIDVPEDEDQYLEGDEE